MTRKELAQTLEQLVSMNLIEPIICKGDKIRYRPTAEDMEMSKHYTKNTVSVTKWCGKCKGQTPHRVDDGRVGGCLSCIERAEEAARIRAAAPAKSKPKQTGFWDGGQS